MEKELTQRRPLGWEPGALRGVGGGQPLWEAPRMEPVLT